MKSQIFLWTQFWCLGRWLWISWILFRFWKFGLLVVRCWGWSGLSGFVVGRHGYKMSYFHDKFLVYIQAIILVLNAWTCIDLAKNRHKMCIRLIFVTFFWHLIMHNDLNRVLIMQSQILCIKSPVLAGTQSVPPGGYPLWNIMHCQPVHYEIFNCTKCLADGEAKINHCFWVMYWGTNLQHFKKGILLILQWTGTKYKNMENVFLDVLTGPAEPWLIHVVCATLVFIYYAHYESHSIDPLRKHEEAWVTFYQNLDYFVKKDIHKSWDHFNIPKLHFMQQLSPVDGYSTESPECLHIDFTKNTYQSTNKKHYIKQMTKWLTHQEACHWFTSYLQ